jgi:molecular chaperone GrpE
MIASVLRRSLQLRPTSAQPCVQHVQQFGCRHFCDVKTDKKAEADQAAATEAAADAEKNEDTTAETAEDLPPTAEEEGQKLFEELSGLKEQVAAAQDRHLRDLAEMENVRTIAKRDVENSSKFAVQKFAKSLLEVADNLSRATETIDVEEPSPEVKTLVEGVVMTQNQLQKVFASFGIEKTGAIGETFDPNFHEAMFEYDDAEQEPGAIGQIISTGYNMKGRCLRAAQVGVIKKRE